MRNLHTKSIDEFGDLNFEEAIIEDPNESVSSHPSSHRSSQRRPPPLKPYTYHLAHTDILVTLHTEEMKHLATEETQIEAAIDKNKAELEEVRPNV